MKSNKNCKHQFFELRNVNINYVGEEEFGSIYVVCALCGERRLIYPTGKIAKYNIKKDLWEKLKNE